VQAEPRLGTAVPNQIEGFRCHVFGG